MASGSFLAKRNRWSAALAALRPENPEAHLARCGSRIKNGRSATVFPPVPMDGEPVVVKRYNVKSALASRAALVPPPRAQRLAQRPSPGVSRHTGGRAHRADRTPLGPVARGVLAGDAGLRVPLTFGPRWKRRVGPNPFARRRRIGIFQRPESRRPPSRRHQGQQLPGPGWRGSPHRPGRSCANTAGSSAGHRAGFWSNFEGKALDGSAGARFAAERAPRAAAQ